MAITNTLHDLGNLTGNATTAGAGYKVSNLYKQAYSDAVRLQIQQFDSLLSDTLQRESIEGEVKSFDRLDKKSTSDLLTRTRSGLYGIKNGVVATDTVLAADAVYGASDTQRRFIEPQWFEYAELFDPRDSQGLMKAVRPDSNYLRNLAAIFNRKKDEIILAALSANVLVQQRTGQGITVNKTVAFGSETASDATPADATATHVGSFDWSPASAANEIAAYNGYEGREVGCKLAKRGEGVVATTGVLAHDDNHTDRTPLVAYLPGAFGAGDLWLAGTVAASLISSNTDTTLDVSGVTSFNVEKLLRARQKLEATNALMPGSRYICVLHPDQFYSLMADANDTRFTSIDFNDGKPLTSGEAFQFMGFEFRISNLVPQVTIDWAESDAAADVNWDGTDLTLSLQDSGGNPIRYAYFYTEQCGIFGMNADMSIRFDEIPERGYALQMWHQIGMNAMRMDGDCIVRAASVDAPA